MRKIEQAMLKAIDNAQPFHSTNTRVETDGITARVFLHGNHIATIRHDLGTVTVTTAGWTTRTTSSRLHAIVSHFWPGSASVNIANGVMYASASGHAVVLTREQAAQFSKDYDDVQVRPVIGVHL